LRDLACISSTLLRAWQQILNNRWFADLTTKDLGRHQIQELHGRLGNESVEKRAKPGIKEILKVPRKVPGNVTKKKH
jgi:hypothetical protein